MHESVSALSPESRFAAVTDGVVCDVIEGEAILIRLDTGAYYSLTGLATPVFKALQDGWSAAEIAAALCAGRAEASSVTGGVQALAAQLVDEKLLQAAPRASAAGEATLSPVEGDIAIPKLEKFSDMTDLLLLDPIHEVDKTKGWPTSA